MIPRTCAMGSSEATCSSRYVFSFMVVVTYGDCDFGQVARHIFLGPMSALNMALKKGTKSCNAFLHDMTTVEPEHIAYICVQVSSPMSLLPNLYWLCFQTCFAISSMSCWSEKDGEFSYRELYRLVVSFIRNAVNVDWRDDLLKWWNL